MTRPQAELPLYDCAPAAGEVGVARCYEHRLDANPRQAARNVRVVKRVCPRPCPCPTCLEGDAMVAAFDERRPA